MSQRQGRVTAASLRRMKARGERIVMLTAYDYRSARIFDEAGVDVLLVGDSLGRVVLGYESTVPVTLEDVLHHTRAVSRGAARALVVADLPFLTYSTPERALGSAGRLLQEGGAQCVKLEGGRHATPMVTALVEQGIPVMGHLGLTPQSIHRFGGHRVQGREAAAAERLVEDAQALEAAGACAVVLELIPAGLAERITAAIKVPTVGIGAGPGCDGQVQVMYDLFTYGPEGEFVPKHAKRYADVGTVMREAAGRYADEVRRGAFPTEEQSFS
jgi:3-methyl-2-oxobutanoate hydroxymethyltransferase